MAFDAIQYLQFPVTFEFNLIPFPIYYILLKHQSYNKYSTMSVHDTAWMCLMLGFDSPGSSTMGFDYINVSGAML